MRKVLNTPLVSHEMHRYLSDPHHSHSFGLFCSLSLSLNVRRRSSFTTVAVLFHLDRDQMSLSVSEPNIFVRIAWLCARYFNTRHECSVTHTHTHSERIRTYQLTWTEWMCFICFGSSVRLLLYHKLFIRNAIGMRTHFSGIFGIYSSQVCWCACAWTHTENILMSSWTAVITTIRWSKHQCIDSMWKKVWTSFTAAIFFGPNYISYTLLLRREWWAIQSSMGIDVMKTVLMLSIFHFKFTHK